jgi:hypothetical protein
VAKNRFGVEYAVNTEFVNIYSRNLGEKLADLIEMRPDTI